MSDGTIDGADASPLIHIAVILLQNNKRNSKVNFFIGPNFFLDWCSWFKDLLSYIDTVLRVALNRLYLDFSCLSKLISVTASHRPKAQESIQGGVNIVNTLFDILGDGFRMKTKMAPSTIKILIEVCLNQLRCKCRFYILKVLMSAEISPLAMPSPLGQRGPLSNLTDDAFSFLQNHPWLDDPIENDFEAAIATGKLLLQAAQSSPMVFQKFADHTPDVYFRHFKNRNILTDLRFLCRKREIHVGSALGIYSSWHPSKRYMMSGDRYFIPIFWHLQTLIQYSYEAMFKRVFLPWKRQRLTWINFTYPWNCGWC